MGGDRQPIRLSVLGAGAGLLGLLLGGCGGSGEPEFDPAVPLRDGVYSGESDPDEQGAYGVATVEVAAGQIVGSEYVTVEASGALKDEDYGKDSSGQVANRDAYLDAQAAVAAFDVYAAQLIEVGDPADVDVVAGATIAHGQFTQAATRALLEAQSGGAAPEGE
ncbi:MAG: FMN-binding protein [Propionibacteriaceae bacterium]|jgi:major membrane immunogen (membrane-anchored lipoprotein)|nr:FMN-binding protein [Propionibacteriaceae bacterium]